MKQYDIKYITKILLILQDNNYDIPKTAREEKVNRQTLYRWKKQYGVEVWKDTAHVEEISIPKEKKEKKKINPGTKIILAKGEIAVSATEIKEKSEAVVFKLLQAIESKLDKDIEDGKISLSQLTNTLDKTIPYILAKFDNKGSAGAAGNMENTYNVFIQNMYNKLND